MLTREDFLDLSRKSQDAAHSIEFLCDLREVPPRPRS